MEIAPAPLRTATIVLADDHPLTREGIRDFLNAVPGLTVIAEAGNGPEALRLVERFSPDVLITDISMPGLDGLDVTRQVSQRYPSTRVVVLSMYDDEWHALGALRAGALGYVLKRAHPEDLVRAVQAAREDRRFLSAPLSERAIEAYAARMTPKSTDPYDTLSVREREVLDLIVRGMTYQEITSRLGISQNTIEYHRKSITRKLGAHTREDLVRYTLTRILNNNHK